MRTNRWPGRCKYCGNHVAPRAGRLWKENGRYVVAHLSCADAKSSQVLEFRTSGGTYYLNRSGRCEDAPCCGCCTI